MRLAPAGWYTSAGLVVSPRRTTSRRRSILKASTWYATSWRRLWILAWVRCGGQPVIALVYDVNNPACTPGGKIDEQYRTVKGALCRPATPKRATWQAIPGVLAARGGYEELLVWLEEKYGITVD
jgi:hypothetical protein